MCEVHMDRKVMTKSQMFSVSYIKMNPETLVSV
jgi:hypothetical protein